jgi:hypothetical protein
MSERLNESANNNNSEPTGWENMQSQTKQLYANESEQRAAQSESAERRRAEMADDMDPVQRLREEARARAREIAVPATEASADVRTQDIADEIAAETKVMEVHGVEKINSVLGVIEERKLNVQRLLQETRGSQSASQAAENIARSFQKLEELSLQYREMLRKEAEKAALEQFAMYYKQEVYAAAGSMQPAVKTIEDKAMAIGGQAMLIDARAVKEGVNMILELGNAAGIGGRNDKLV